MAYGGLDQSDKIISNAGKETHDIKSMKSCDDQNDEKTKSCTSGDEDKCLIPLQDDHEDDHERKNEQPCFWIKYQKYIVCGIVVVGVAGFVYLYHKMEQMEETQLARRVKTMEETLSEMKQNMLPSGTIAIWLKDKIPNGWKVCDGSNGTHDFVGKGIYGNPGGKWMPDRKTPYDCAFTIDEQQINTSVRFIQKM
eukprot:172429_1